MSNSFNDKQECPICFLEEEVIAPLRARVKELEEGKCRFNCRTKKEAFLAGWDAAYEDNVDGGYIICDKFYKKVTEKAYKKWRGK